MHACIEICIFFNIALFYKDKIIINNLIIIISTTICISHNLWVIRVHVHWS